MHQKLDQFEEEGEGHHNRGGSLGQGGGGGIMASARNKILVAVVAVLAAIAVGVGVYFGLLKEPAVDTPMLKITHKATLTIGDKRGEVRGKVVIGVFGEHVPVTATNFVALANHTKDKEPGSTVNGFGYIGSIFNEVMEQDYDHYVEGGDMIQQRKDGLAIYNAQAMRLSGRFWARDQNNPQLTWENGPEFAKDNLTDCCRREGWIAMKDISYSDGENPAYSSIFKIFTLTITWNDTDKDLVFGKVLEGMDLVKKIAIDDLIKDSECVELSQPILVEKPGIIEKQ